MDRLHLSRRSCATAISPGSRARASSGVTSNPTIFQAAIADGDAYDEQLREVLQSETDPKEVFLALAREDVRDACDILRRRLDRGETTRDGWVSLEVDPNLAHDTAGSGQGGQAAARDGRARRTCS